MKYSTFVSEAKKTLSNTDDLDQLDYVSVVETLEDFIKAGQRLDKLKKAIFYNSEKRIRDFHGDRCHFSFSEYGKYDSNTLHAVLGIATESVEQVEAIYASLIEKREFDEVNLKEELGDLFWYIAILLKTEEELESTLDRNIAKLRARYTNSEFDSTSSEDENRDLEKERQILSQSSTN